MTADQKNVSAPVILIILMGSLGDVVRGLAIVCHLKSILPDSRIIWLIEPRCADLLSVHPQIDKVIVFNRTRRFPAVLDLYKQLRREPFDYTLDLQRHLKSGFFSLLSNCKRRIGFHQNNSKELNWIFNNEHINYYGDDVSKLDHYFKFTEYLGLPEPSTVDFGISNLDLKKYLPPPLADSKRPYVAVLMGTRWETKDWSLEGYIQLVQEITACEDLQVSLIGDGRQAGGAKNILTRMNAAGLINLVGQTSLLELTAVLKHAAAASGPDSGPGHLAAALQTPYVTLFGPTSPQRTAPHGCEHLVVHAELNCAPCYKKQCPEHTNQCMQAIKVDTVMEKLSIALHADTNRWRFVGSSK
jgi:lipopolysaccharide heptosyltransferase II